MPAVGHREQYYAELADSSPAVAETYPWRDGQAEWKMLGWYSRQRSSPIAVLTVLDVLNLFM